MMELPGEIMKLSGEMFELAGGIIIVLGFLIFIKIFGLVEKSTKVISIAKSSMTIVQNASLDDFEKEVAMQKHAKKLFSLFLLISIGSAIALAIPFSLIWLMEYNNLLTAPWVSWRTLSAEFIIGTIIFSICFFWLMRKKQ